MKKKIIYIGNFSFPLGNAVAKRVLGIGKVLFLAGYDVVFIGEDQAVELGTISEELTYEQFKYYNIHKALSAKEHYKYQSDVKCICEKLQFWKEHDEIATVIFCGTKSALFANAIVNKCKKMDIPVIADSMDWLSSRTGNLLFDCVKQFDTCFELRIVNRKANAIIAISSFLAQYYRNKGMESIVIPPISPYENAENVTNGDKEIKLIYAGIPCRIGRPLKNVKDAKDRLDLVIQLLYSIQHKGYNYKFYVYGLTKEQYMVIYPQQSLMVEELVTAQTVHFMGYAKEHVVREAIEQADYTILLRDKNKVSMAGFPTKISESIALGIPVITTETSDITNYVSEGRDGYFLDITDLSLAEKKLLHILKQGKEHVELLKKNARNNYCFKPDSYIEKIKWILDVAISDTNKK